MQYLREPDDFYYCRYVQLRHTGDATSKLDNSTSKLAEPAADAGIQPESTDNTEPPRPNDGLKPLLFSKADKDLPCTLFLASSRKAGILFCDQTYGT